MSVTIEDPEFEAILADVAASSGRDGSELLVDLLKREQARLAQSRLIAEGLAADEEMRACWMALPLVDPRPIDEILAFDENGLPA